MEKRRAYLKRRVAKARVDIKVKKGRPPMNRQMTFGIRSGMLSEHATILGMLSGIQAGTLHPDTLYNQEDDPEDE
jgi:hypothetical protein